MFLANCDPVRRLATQEIEKRFMLGVLLTGGVVLTPSLLLDNPAFIEVLSRPNVRRWFDGDGAGTLQIRSPWSNGSESITAFFDSLPEGYILNRYKGTPKGQLSRLERWDLKDELSTLDGIIRSYGLKIGDISLQTTALSDSIITSSTLKDFQQKSPEYREPLEHLLQMAPALNSRSMWYQAAEELPHEMQSSFKLEVIDTAYHGLFIDHGEAFALDQMAGIETIPAAFLDTGIRLRNLRKQYEYIGYGMKAFDLITAMGAGQLMKFLTDEAISYIEDKASEKGHDWASRKNWFGLNKVISRKIGVEIK